MILRVFTTLTSLAPCVGFQHHLCDLKKVVLLFVGLHNSVWWRRAAACTLLQQMPWQCSAKMRRWDVCHPNSCTSFGLRKWSRFGTPHPRTRLSHISHGSRSCNPRHHSHNMLCGRTLNLWNWTSWCGYNIQFLVRSSHDGLRKAWYGLMIYAFGMIFIFYFLTYYFNIWFSIWTK